jgi:hypothetical protein
LGQSIAPLTYLIGCYNLCPISVRAVLPARLACNNFWNYYLLVTFTFVRRSSHIVRMDVGELPIACVRLFVTISLQSDAFVHEVEEMEPRSANTLKVDPGNSRHGYSDRIQHTLMTSDASRVLRSMRGSVLDFSCPDRQAIADADQLTSSGHDAYANHVYVP